ncbi:MAG: ATP-dependent RNA helicase RhlE [Azospira oryzae]|nr:MAG: ATP-dependent RNA helicase RhlE [Azospira oryzae]PZP79435.1 MAG: ATP-dependent RNA helicase RhlE [Azospira oryzae]
MQFSDLGLIPELLKAVAEQGYTAPTPVQAQAIPLILAGRDVMAAAQTGTGKTAAFTLPILQLLKPLANTSTSPARHPVRALILAPTRELAAQVEESVRVYGAHIPLRHAVVYGGVDMDPQMEVLRQGVEILVATPGRLLDHVHQRTVNLSQVAILVLDEADRMLDMGFLPDIRRLLELLPPRRQNLLFSATFSEDIVRLASTFLNNPARVQVAPRNAPADLVRQVVFPVDSTLKRALLEHLLTSRGMRQVLVFTATKIGANRLARALERDGFQAVALHSDRTQAQREQALADFKAGKIRVLVATDIAGRGLDIEELPHVVNFEIPHHPEDYVHRIGRTGRAGMEGEAYSFVAPEEEKYLAAIERLLKRSIPREVLPEFAPGSRSPARAHRDPAHRERRGDSPSPPFKTPSRAPEAPRPAEPGGPSSAPLHFHRRRREQRPVPALLGGVPIKKP